MNDNGENKKTVYDIPGVIIPPQTTENGGVIKTAIDDSKEIINNGQVVSVTAPEQIVNTNININSSPSPSPIINDPININNNQVNITNTTLEKDTKEIKKEEFKTDSNIPNKEKKNNNLLLIFIIILLLGVIIYFVYNTYFAKKEEKDPVKEWQLERVVNTTSLVVQQLYNYVNLDGCDNQINFFYGEQMNVSINDLNDEVKNYLAYRQLKHTKIEKKNCSNNKVALHKNDNVGLWYCGDDYLTSNNSNYDDTNAITYTTKEENIKEQVEKIFGVGTYKAKTFAISSSERYLYDNKTSTYILQTFNGVNSCQGFTNKLDNSYQKGDDLTIVVKVTNNETKQIQMFYYTFTESNDGNYYFNTLVKQNV